jgi:hypothetical protein
MPKLNPQAAKTTSEAESTGGLMDDGIYRMQLRSVKVSDKPGPSGHFYWTWEFEVPADADQYPKRRQWATTSLSPEAAWKLKEVFDAFEVPVDTDTDELIGRYVDVEVGHRTISKGQRAGELANSVGKLFPAGVSTGAGSSDTTDYGF